MAGDCRRCFVCSPWGRVGSARICRRETRERLSRADTDQIIEHVKSAFGEYVV